MPWRRQHWLCNHARNHKGSKWMCIVNTHGRKKLHGFFYQRECHPLWERRGDYICNCCHVPQQVVLPFTTKDAPVNCSSSVAAAHAAGAIISAKEEQATVQLSPAHVPHNSLKLKVLWSPCTYCTPIQPYLQFQRSHSTYLDHSDHSSMYHCQHVYPTGEGNIGKNIDR